MREWLSGRAPPCQGERREFESRLPLQKNPRSIGTGIFQLNSPNGELNVLSHAKLLRS